MKSTLLFWLLLLGLGSAPGWGQTPAADVGNPLKELRASLGGLDPNRIPTGVLLNRMMLSTNPHRFAGQGDTTISYQGFQQQYWEFYHAALDSSQLLTLDALRSRTTQKVQQGVVPLLMLQYQYNELLATAARDQLITIDSTNERVYDGPNFSRSPYSTGQLFSVVLPVPTTRTTLSVYVGPEYWLGNTPAPGGLQIDFGDGLGTRYVSMGSTVQVQLANPAARTTGSGQLIKVTNPATGLGASATLQTLSLTSIPPDVALGVLASRSWPGFTPNRPVYGPNGRATAIAWIKYAASNTTGKLRRPLVFVEGIDFDSSPNIKATGGLAGLNHYVSQTGPIPLTDFTNTLSAQIGGYRNGAAGWNEMVDYNFEYRSLEKFPELRAQLQAPRSQNFSNGGTGGDYDIIYFDFSDGATLIQHNAMALVELLQWINQPANRTADAEETLVIGASMGGQVARFALAWMEQQNLCHNSKLYVSFDSPHRGADVPLGLQHLFNRLQSILIGSGGPQDVVRNKLLREATMQMVLFHYNDGATPLRNQWQTWQASPGSYPSLLRKVAIANGSGQAVPQLGMYPGIQLTHTIGFATGQIAGLNYAYALPGISSRGRNNVVFRYLRPYALTGNWHYSYADPSWSYFDTAPGSSERTVADAHDQSGSLAIDWPSNTFMATVSSLDIKDAGSYNSPNLGYNVQQQIDRNKPNRAKYAFDAYSSADNVNEPHVQITNGQPSAYSYNTSYYTDNGTWIQNELRQSAHNMPALLTTIYNYGSPYRHLLPSVQVNGGGQLHFNNGGLPVNGGTPATQGAPPQGNFEAYTSNCPTVVQVNSGGQVSVGVSASYTAALQISANSLLDLRTGGQTTVAAGSVLHIAAGGTLVVRQGATLTVAGQLIVDNGAYVCLENGQSITTTGAGQVSVGASAYYYANPALGLSGLSCQPTLCKSSIRLSAQCREVTAPGGCSTTSLVTASGSSLGVDYRWTVDGQAVAAANGKASISVFTSQSSNRHTVSVQVSSTCPGGSPVTASTMVGCSFPDCGPRPRGAVAMYPNPATSSVDFSAQPDNAAPASKALLASPAASEPTDYEVSLYDGQGALRWQGSSRAGRLRLDSSHLPRGIYGVVITQGKTISRQNLSLE